MVIQSEVNEKMPPGGASFAGNFHKDAFNAFVYPKPGARRTERQEHKATSLHPAAQHKASIFFTMAKEMQQPSRLRKMVDKHVDAEANKPKAFWADAEEKYNSVQRQKAADGIVDEEPVEKPVEIPEGGRTWCPHPSLLRGNCRLNRPRALDWGIDLAAAPGWNCPFWDAPRHRFEGTAALPEARPVTPIRSLRWRDDAVTGRQDWDNPDMHAPWKITHTIPKSNSMVELSRGRMAMT